MKQTTRIPLIFGIVFVGLIFGMLLHFVLSGRPPKEAKLIRNFNAHRATFERLRDMLKEDKQIVRVATWGVEVTNSVVPQSPFAGNIPDARSREYMSLLKEVGSTLAWRSRSEPADPGIGVWASGFGGDTRHLAICWLEQAPPNQIGSLDDYRGASSFGNRISAYKHIDSNWYFWTDL